MSQSNFESQSQRDSCSVGSGIGACEIMLFGVRVKVDQGESSNINNQHASIANGGRERKRGSPWTEDEHKLFLQGLLSVGKGQWIKISKDFVKTRTPSQIASHAQKYFLHQTNLNRRRRGSSLFDITTDSV